MVEVGGQTLETQKSPERIPLSELPVFDGGNFKLHYFPEGVILKTRLSQLRREGLPENVDANFPASKIRELNANERAFGERKGLNLMRSPGYIPADDSDTLKPSFSPRVNLHNIMYERVDGKSVLSHDNRPTTFPVASNKEILSNPDFAEQFSFTGSAFALRTTESDGSHNTVLGYRLSKNANYPSMAGAAAAGVPNGEFAPVEIRSHDDRGRLLPTENSFFTRGLLKELKEEINLTADQLVGGEPNPIALIWDEWQPHREIGFEGVFNGATEDLIHQAAQNNEEGRSALDFAEEFIVMKGGVDPLRRFLTESESPMPPTHTGLYTALLIRMMSEEYKDNPDQLQKEIGKLQSDMQDHTRRQNARVKEFYEENPDKAEAARLKKYNTDGYDYRVGVVEQGLNDPRQWLKDNDLFIA